MLTNIPVILKRLSLLFLTIFIQIIAVIGVIEIVGQLLFSNPLGGDRRYLYTTQDAVQNFNEFWVYRANIEIHEVSVYESAIGTLFKGSECTYESDGLGFLDNQAADRSPYDILILGDSFAAGQAGCSWVGKLRALLPGKSIYNAGMEASGVAMWWRYWKYLAENGLRFNQTVFLFISDDFFRGNFQWPDAQLRCLHEITDCGTNYFYPLPAEDDLLAVTARRAGRETRSLKSRLAYFWERKLWLTYFLYQNAGNLLRKRSFSGRNQQEINYLNTEAFDNVTSNSSNMRLIRVPTKDETAFHSKNAETLRVDAFLARRNLSYDTCEIGYDGYGTFDGHPTREGYARLADCVAKLIGNR
jgi:hypothetical protein